MIRVNNLQGQPEETPEFYYSTHSDDSYFYFFESDQEHQEFLSLLPNIPQVTPPNPVIEFLQTATPDEISQFKTLLGL
jgi:hypothetical protein